MLAETPVIQRSPCYSAVSASLTNPLPDCSNHSSFCHTHYFISLAGKTLYQATLLETDTSLCFAAESSRDFMSSEEYRNALRNLKNKQRQVVMFLLLLFKLSSQLPFVFVFSLYIHSLSVPFLNPLFSLSPLHHPFALFRSIFCPPKIKTSSFIQLVYLVKLH